MLSQLFLGMSLAGAEWVLYLLIMVSVISVGIIIERVLFYRSASQGLETFRAKIRTAASEGKWAEALKMAHERKVQSTHDLETGLTAALLEKRRDSEEPLPDVLSEIAHDEVLRARLFWEKNLAVLATVGSNAPFLGLFGTVLGIIRAFHDMSHTATGAPQMVSSGISEALIATAVGILVAIPAVVAFNFFQRRVKAGVSQAEAMKSFLIGKIAE